MIPRPHIACGWLAAFSATLAAVAVPPPAGAAERPRPDEIAAVEVYREQIPTARGPRVTGARSGSGVPLPAAASSALRGEQREPLKQVATSPAFGAPERELPRPSPEKTNAAAQPGPAVETLPEEQAVDAAVAVAANTGSGRVVALAVGLLALSLVLVAIAALRRRATRG